MLHELPSRMDFVTCRIVLGSFVNMFIPIIYLPHATFCSIYCKESYLLRNTGNRVDLSNYFTVNTRTWTTKMGGKGMHVG
jgi:hypothetical protein